MASHLQAEGAAIRSAPQLRVARANAIALAVVALLAAAAPFLVSEYWLKGILIPTMVFGLAALGLNLVSGYAGLISMGQAAFMALGAFTAAITYGRFGLPLPLAIVAAGSVAAMVGVVVGTPSLRIKGLYLMAATLAAQFIIIWVLQRVPWTGSGSFATLGIPPLRFASWNIGTTVDKYYLVLGVVALMTFFARNLVTSRIGRAWMALRDHEVAATVMGVSPLRFKLLAFLVSSFYAGVAGSLVVFGWTGAASVQEYELEVSIEILGMIIVGGLGSVLGSYLGAAFILLLPILIAFGMHQAGRLLGTEHVSVDLLANAEHIVFGALVLFFLIKEPQGLARLWHRLAEKADSRMHVNAAHMADTGESK
jgi:branched-chain amino acid transport system permease protein